MNGNKEAEEKAHVEAERSYALAQDNAEIGFQAVDTYREKIEAIRLRVDAVLGRYVGPKNACLYFLPIADKSSMNLLHFKSAENETSMYRRTVSDDYKRAECIRAFKDLMTDHHTAKVFETFIDGGSTINLLGDTAERRYEYVRDIRYSVFTVSLSWYILNRE